MLENQTIEAEKIADPRLTDLANIGSLLAHDIVDIAGFLAEVDVKSTAQFNRVSGLSGQAEGVLTANASVQQAMASLMESSELTATAIGRSVEQVRIGGERSSDIAAWVQKLSTQMDEMVTALRSVMKSNEAIASIAAQVNILAINAKIEAARAGDAGRGFAVVAEAINELSGRTSKSAESITQDVSALSTRITGLNEETTRIERTAELVLENSRVTNDAMSQISEASEKSSSQVKETLSQAKSVQAAVEDFLPAFEDIATIAKDTAQGVHHVSEKTDALIDKSEAVVQQTVALGGETLDAAFISRVKSDAERISALLEEAVDTGRISLGDLFSRTYTPIPGTNPEQVLAPFTKLTDELLPPITEQTLASDKRVVFCAAVDTKGYLPTHNQVFSKPQGSDPIWNTANCRNRRIFDDRVGLKAGKSTEPFLLQVYRRDMGGGKFVLMKDLSAPITVKGKHWGGLRMAYRVD